MGYSIVSPTKSFVQFNAATPVEHCIWGSSEYCLPILADDDLSFQFFVIADTEEEADALCVLGESGLVMELVRVCNQAYPDVELTGEPERYRISTTQVLYNWPHGVSGAIAEYALGECFYIRASVAGEVGCSNCLQRIADGCFSSVLEYGNDENFGGFNYCNSGAVDTDVEGVDCEPTFVTFLNESVITIPYTAMLQAKYGDLPSVQVWVYNGDGDLQNIGVVAKFDNYPVNLITIDLGGTSSGVVKIS